MTENLDVLIRSLDRLQGRASLTELTEQLQQSELDAQDVAGFLRFAEPTYQRVLVRAGQWYHLWVLCWKNGQRSPIHDHVGSNCAVRVLRGTATVTDYAFADKGYLKAVATHELPAGSVFASHDDDLHQVFNLQPGSLDLVTLHIYSPPLLRMGTYSLGDRMPGKEGWPIQHTDAESMLYDMNAHVEENMLVPLDVKREFAAGGGI